jgi:DNA-3-methyladenine glycosylase I
MRERRRCEWAGSDPLYQAYHDQEWGVPVHDERHLFEMLILEGAQAGLAWITILRKREGYRRAFAGFDPRRMARFGPRDVKRLLADSGIVRHEGKIRAAIGNAAALLALQAEGQSLDRLVWEVAGGRPRRNRRRHLREAPDRTPESEALSRTLRRRGFKFVGPTICYALMQAVGVVNDHTAHCFRYREV